MEETIVALHAEGLKVSVDSADLAELERASHAGADHLLSLDEHSLDILTEAPDWFPFWCRRRMAIWIRCSGPPPRRGARH